VTPGGVLLFSTANNSFCDASLDLRDDDIIDDHMSKMPIGSLIKQAAYMGLFSVGGNIFLQSGN
jgi:hypothetical protein